MSSAILSERKLNNNNNNNNNNNTNNHTHGPLESCDVSPTDQCASDQPHKHSLISDFIYKHSIQHMIAGSSAGVFSKILMQPLDLIKTRMQVQDGRGINEYKSVRHAFRSIVVNDGVVGLYRGLLPNLLGSGVSWGIYFFSYNQFKNLWRYTFNYNDTGRLPPQAHLFCAAATGCITSLVTNPIWLIKVRLQLQGKDVKNHARQYTGITDAFVRIVREEGFFALYRGIGPALLLVSNGALQFMFYEQLKRIYTTHRLHTLNEQQSNKQLNSIHALWMGGLAKGLSATITYPLMNCRSRLYQKKPDTSVLKQINTNTITMQSNNNNITTQHNSNADATIQLNNAIEHAKKHKHADHKYANLADVFVKVYRYEGIRGFYRGLSAQLMKTVPASAITFFGYESTLKIINTALPHVDDTHTH